MKIFIVIMVLVSACFVGAFADWKATHDKKTWNLIKGRYVCTSPWVFGCVVTFESAIPLIVLSERCELWVAGATMLAILAVASWVFVRRLELREREIIFRNDFGMLRTVCIEDILEVYEQCNRVPGGVSQVMFVVSGIKSPIYAVSDLCNGLPELLLILDRRCPGVVRWDKMPRLRQRMQQKTTK